MLMARGIGELFLLSDAEILIPAAHQGWRRLRFGGRTQAETCIYDAGDHETPSLAVTPTFSTSLRTTTERSVSDGYGYTQFKKYVTEYRKNHDVSYHNTYEPGDEWQIDFAGDPLYVTDRLTKSKIKVVVLVCVMPYSNLPFIMTLPSAKTEYFYHGLNKGLEFVGALPKVAKSDNMKQWVTKSDRYSPTFSDANVEWGFYYGASATTACRVRSPRDKGPVEGAVNQLYRFIYARIESEGGVL